MVMTLGFLAETTEGYISHNGLSRAIIEDGHLNHWLFYMVKQTVPFMGCLIPAVEKWGDSKQGNQTAYNIMRDTDLPFFDFLKSRPDLGAEFDAYMESLAVVRSGTRIDYLLQGFDWADLGAAVVVHVILIQKLNSSFSGSRCVAH